MPSRQNTNRSEKGKEVMIFNKENQATLSKLASIDIGDEKMQMALTQAAAGEDVEKDYATAISWMAIGLLTEDIKELEADGAPSADELKAVLVEHYGALNPAPKYMTAAAVKAALYVYVNSIIDKGHAEPDFCWVHPDSDLHH
jgi:hypothetical protein